MFEASNGYEISEEIVSEQDCFKIKSMSGSNVLDSYNFLDEYDMEALEEYFQAKRDKELGRWRWPENPTYVVYGNNLPDIYVVEESKGVWGQWHERELTHREVKRDALARAASAYLETLPLIKPWLDAKPGEVWILNFADFPNTDVSSLVKEGVFTYNDPCCDERMPLDSDEIVSARRIWPEGKTNDN